MAMASRPVVRSLMAAAAATAPRSGARDIPRWGLQRYLSAGGDLIAEEGKAAEAGGELIAEEGKAAEAYHIKKEEQKLAQMGPCSEDATRPTHAPVGNEKSRPRMVDLMKVVEDNDYGILELKHALRVVRRKCGPNRIRIESELFVEHSEDKVGSKMIPVQTSSHVLKEAALRAAAVKAVAENERAHKKYMDLERKVAANNKKIWQKLPTALTAVLELMKSLRH